MAVLVKIAEEGRLARAAHGRRFQRIIHIGRKTLSKASRWDGTPPSMYAVDRAAEVAQAAHAKLVVVTAYRDGDPSTASSPVNGLHRDLYGAAAARKALEKSVTGLTKERARYVEQRLVPGDPAQALLDTVGSNPANVIVVGNRGLGASEGQRLGSVPSNVVKNAVCDVLVVQTSALDEGRMFAEEPAEAAADGAGPVTGADPGRRSPTR
jgi:maltose/moltooligosaccharide transporter